MYQPLPTKKRSIKLSLIRYAYLIYRRKENPSIALCKGGKMDERSYQQALEEVKQMKKCQ